jgi:hypothetical protein
MRVAVLTMVALALGCGRGHGRTGDDLVDACLHWTACTTPPPALPPSATGDNLAACMMSLPITSRLPWNGGGVAVTPDQIRCLAEADLDCGKALDCVAPASTCSSPAWSCEGDVLVRCESFGAGARTTHEDCAAAGLRCVSVGDEARCGLGACDPKTFASVCMANQASPRPGRGSRSSARRGRSSSRARSAPPGARATARTSTTATPTAISASTATRSATTAARTGAARPDERAPDRLEQR